VTTTPCSLLTVTPVWKRCSRGWWPPPPPPSPMPDHRTIILHQPCAPFLHRSPPSASPLAAAVAPTPHSPLPLQYRTATIGSYTQEKWQFFCGFRQFRHA
jgi:hypothetical protein